jgi:hypothetical protein
VLHGECRLLVEGEERLLRRLDFFHCPAWTEHIFVGAGDGPCVILMAGARSGHGKGVYPVSELAARYGASVETETSDPDQAYAGSELARLGRPASWSACPGPRSAASGAAATMNPAPPGVSATGLHARSRRKDTRALLAFVGRSASSRNGSHRQEPSSRGSTASPMAEEVWR